MSKEKINELIKFYAEWRDEHKASLDEGTVRAINNKIARLKAQQA